MAPPPSRPSGRTVHPELTAAVLWAVTAGAAPPAPAARLAERHLADGAPVPEQLHRELLAHLHRLGWPTVLAAARRLFARPRDPLLRSLVAAEDVADLLTRSRLAEPWLYIGHTTRADLRPGELTVRHLGHLGHRPLPAETLFVCALHLTAVATVTAQDVDAVLLTGDGRTLPPSAVHPTDAPAPIAAWRLRWTDTATAPTAPHPAERRLLGEVRRRIALDPAAPWRVGDTATSLGLSARTLQRALRTAGTTFQAELTAVRLDTAGHLLRRTDLPLADIAAAAGFTDHPHLTRCFRAHHGCTPSQFRRRSAEAAH
ncbi:helix-turn-helix transcriptional regulator [Kitasatospora sp. NPDC085464]|uniref:helix-turn-helix transcriptional regulator n=1 Tax=Kitasatospora sp. NPDC085464 TaxID=3364063 RepID=UPI0037C99FAF